MLFYATNQLRLACAAVKESYPDLSMVSQEWLDIMNSSRLDSAQYNVEETDFELWKYSVSTSPNRCKSEVVMRYHVIVLISSNE